MFFPYLKEGGAVRHVLQDGLRERRSDHHRHSTLAGAHGLGRLRRATARHALRRHHGDRLGESHQVHEQRDGHALQAEVWGRAAGVHQRLQPQREAEPLAV